MNAWCESFLVGVLLDDILCAVKPAALVLAFAGLAALPASAASVDALVSDASGAPLDNAVVWAMPKGAVPARPKREGAIEQIGKQFVPLVTVVQAGTQVRFPNRDEIRHHVYSFSPAKAFEIKLYAGTPAEPVLFDKPGEVVLGCNIHDHMIAYLYVVDTPFFAKAGKDGRARLEGLPAGEYELHAWHYAQAARPDAKPLRLRADEGAGAAFALATRPLPPLPAAR
jgi:plastocyanin